MPDTRICLCYTDIQLKALSRRIEVFNMKIIMRRDSIIFYFENNRIDNAIRRCLSNWNLRFQFEMSIRSLILVSATSALARRISPQTPNPANSRPRPILARVQRQHFRVFPIPSVGRGESRPIKNREPRLPVFFIPDPWAACTGREAPIRAGDSAAWRRRSAPGGRGSWR